MDNFFHAFFATAERTVVTVVVIVVGFIFFVPQASNLKVSLNENFAAQTDEDYCHNTYQVRASKCNADSRCTWTDSCHAKGYTGGEGGGGGTTGSGQLSVSTSCSSGSPIATIQFLQGALDTWLDLGTKANFSGGSYTSKNIPHGVTSTIAPSGFSGLSFTAGSTYYVRAYDGASQTRTNPVSFKAPSCGSGTINSGLNDGSGTNSNASRCDVNNLSEPARENCIAQGNAKCDVNTLIDSNLCDQFTLPNFGDPNKAKDKGRGCVNYGGGGICEWYAVPYRCSFTRNFVGSCSQGTAPVNLGGNTNGLGTGTNTGTGTETGTGTSTGTGSSGSGTTTKTPSCSSWTGIRSLCEQNSSRCYYDPLSFNCYPKTSPPAIKECSAFTGFSSCTTQQYPACDWNIRENRCVPKGYSVGNYNCGAFTSQGRTACSSYSPNCKWSNNACVNY